MNFNAHLAPNPSDGTRRHLAQSPTLPNSKLKNGSNIIISLTLIEDIRLCKVPAKTQSCQGRLNMSVNVHDDIFWIDIVWIVPHMLYHYHTCSIIKDQY